MMGTAKYLSPEQVRGRKLDGRADLYSLGLVLYECLAGRVPFLGETDADTALARLQRDPTDLGRLRPTLPHGLVDLIHRLLARNPDHRPATGAELRAALLARRRRTAGRPTHAGAPPDRRADHARPASPVGRASGAHGAAPSPGSAADPRRAARHRPGRRVVRPDPPPPTRHRRRAPIRGDAGTGDADSASARRSCSSLGLLVVAASSCSRLVLSDRRGSLGIAVAATHAAGADRATPRRRRHDAASDRAATAPAATIAGRSSA